MSTLFDIWNTIQKKLFPWLEQELDPLSDKEREFVQVVSLLDLGSHMKESWIGYKLHLDCIDGDIPVSAILSSASLHDSQAAIPLSQMSYQRLTNL